MEKATCLVSRFYTILLVSTLFQSCKAIAASARVCKQRGQFTINFLVKLPALVVALIVLASMVMSPAGAAVYYVKVNGDDSKNGLSWNNAKKTVQAALNAAQYGDEVWVARGTYFECITLKSGVALYGGFAGTELTRDGRNWSANVTILDGNQGGSVVTVSSGATNSTRIDGFTIRNGSAGGIYCLSGLPTIANNTITSNSAFEGGGISCYDSPTITNNIITSNSAVYGGGIYCWGSSTISSNTITSNIASENGGGICCFGSSTISSNTIKSNSTSYGYGGGIFCSGLPTIANNTITSNSADYGCGGGIYCNGLPTIANNIVAFNSSGIYCDGSSPSLRCNCVYNPAGSNYYEISPGNGDIQVDPLFVDRNVGDYHLRAGSPCIDAGDDEAVQPDWLDIDGQPRVIGLHVDIGADEFLPDTVSPSVTINQSSDQTDPTSVSPIKFTVIFSEPVSGFGSEDVLLGGTAGATTAVVTGSGTTYTVLVSGMSRSGTVRASIPAGVAQDGAGNLNLASTSTDNEVTYNLPDTVSPSVTINQSSDQTDPTSVSPIKFTVIFSEPVSGFGSEDVLLGGTAGATTAVVTGSGTTYTVLVSGMSRSGTVRASIPAGVAQDAAGNLNLASTSTDNEVTYDNDKPEVSIVFPTSQDNCVRNCSSVTISGTAADSSSEVVSVEWSNNRGGSGTCTGTTNWKAKGVALFPGDNVIIVTATDKVGNKSIDELKITYEDYQPGSAWYWIAMVSLPIIPDSTDPKEVVGFARNYWCVYDPSAGSYIGYPDSRAMLDPTSKTPGRGFWAVFLPGDQPHPCGLVPDQTKEFRIKLEAGWNIIGNPFVTPVVWNRSAIKVQESGKEPVAIKDASDVVCDFAWGWDPVAGSYYLVHDESVAPGARSELEPWQGYWIKAKKPCDLILPAP